MASMAQRIMELYLPQLWACLGLKYLHDAEDVRLALSQLITTLLLARIEERIQLTSRPSRETRFLHLHVLVSVNVRDFSCCWGK